MLHIWIVMAIGAQLIWAFGNYLDNYLLKRYRLTTKRGGPGTIILISSVTAAIVTLLVGLASGVLPYLDYEGDTSLSVTPLQALKGLGVGVVQIAWMILYLYAMEESEEMEAVPLFQTVPLFAFFLGLTVFDEVTPVTALLGSIGIVGGALLLNFNLKTLRLNKSVVVMMLASSFFVAFAAFMFKRNAEETNYLSSVFWMKLGMVITGTSVCFFVPSFRRQFTLVINKGSRTDIGLNFLNEFLDRLARLAFFGAIMLGPSVVSVQATAGYQPMLLFLIGLLWAKNGSSFHAERYKKEELVKKIAGVTLIGLGSFLIFN